MFQFQSVFCRLTIACLFFIGCETKTPSGVDATQNQEQEFLSLEFSIENLSIDMEKTTTLPALYGKYPDATLVDVSEQVECRVENETIAGLVGKELTGRLAGDTKVT